MPVSCSSVSYSKRTVVPCSAARGEPAHALILELDVALIVLDVHDVALAVVCEVARVAVGFVDARQARPEVVAAALDVAGRVDDFDHAAKRVVAKGVRRTVGCVQRQATLPCPS